MNSRFNLLVLSLAFCGTLLQAAPETRYVWTNSPTPTVPYLTWQTAAHQLDTALALADADDATVVISTVYTQQVADAGLVLHYTFDQNTGSTVNDVSGHGNTGTVSGAAWVTNGLQGGAYSFDGVDDYIRGSFAPVTGALPRTTALWFYYTGDTGHLFGWGSNTVAAVSAWSLIVHTDHKPFLWNCANDLYGKTTLVTGRWYHIAATYDGTNRVLYLNGGVEGSNGIALATSGARVPEIGQLIGGGGYGINTTIDDVRVYDRALSAREIAGLAGVPVTPTPVSVNDVAGAEGNAGTSNFVFQVTIPATSSFPVSVEFATSNGTAVAGSDYVATNGTLTIPVGQTNGTITVQVLGDTNVEPDETFYLKLPNQQSGRTATSLNGSGQYWTTPTGLTFTGSGSMSMWIKPADVNTFAWIWNQHVPEDPIQDRAGCYFLNGKLTFHVFQGEAFNTNNLAVGQWYHLGFVWTPSNRQFYINGSLAAAGSDGLKTTMPKALWLGRGPNGATFNGSIDEVGMWTRALTSNEMASLYNNGAGVIGDTATPPFSTSFLAGWHFDETSGTNADNFEGTANRDMAATGNPGWNTEAAFVRAVGTILNDDLDVVTPTHYVWTNSPSPLAPYTNWASAARTIQAAVDSAVDGDVVLVTNGIYATGGAAVGGLGLTNRVMVTKAITVQSVNGPEVTIIVGAGPIGNSAVRCVALTNNAVLSGFTLTNGATLAAAVYRKDAGGGGVFCDHGGVISNCVIRNCVAGEGGAVYAWSGGSSLFRCLVEGNSATYYGGGVRFSQSATGVARDCIIRRNYTQGSGGGVHLYHQGTLDNCLVEGNRAEVKGGGVYVDNGSAGGYLNNCTIVGNSAPANGGLGYIIGGASVRNSIVWGNTNGNWSGGSYTYSCTEPLPGGAGNISANPQFVGGGDYRLGLGSPCIDSATNAYAVGLVDLAGNPRIVSGCVDMGAYEYLGVAAESTRGYWRFETDGGVGVTNGQFAGTVDDSSPFHNHGTARNGMEMLRYRADVAQTNLAGVPNAYALEFDGINDHVDLGNPAALQCTTGLTLECWVKPHNNTRAQNLIVKWGGTANSNMGYVLNLNLRDPYYASPVDPGRISFMISTNGTVALAACLRLSSTARLRTNEWSHIAATYDGQVMKIFVNGLLDCSSNAPGVVYGTGDAKVYIGHANDGSGFAFDGLLDEVRILGTAGASQPVPTVRIGDVAQDEGASGTTLLTFPVSLTATSSVPVSVDFGASDGTAEAGSDYMATNGTLTIPAGQTNGVVVVQVIGDGTFEPDEVFSLNLSNPQGVTIGDGQGVGTILNDDLDMVTPIHYVWTNSPGPVAPYTNWASAARTIQAAVDAAADGDTVLVTNGVYNAGGAAVGGLGLTNRVMVTKAITVQSVNGPEVTVIVGSGPIGNSAVRCVALTNNAVLDGFTLTNGATLATGVYRKDAGGGGVLCDHGGVISNCVIRNCAAVEGGAVYAWGAGSSLYKCMIEGNSATHNGGGLRFSQASTGGATDCVIRGNYAAVLGGGVHLYHQATLNNCLIAGNRADSNGGGIYVDNGGIGAYLNNCTIAENSAPVNGGLGYIIGGASVRNSIVWGNTNGNWSGGSYTHSCTEPLPGGAGNISANPQFVGGGDYRLGQGSPCIDSATNAYAVGLVDLAGNPRVFNGCVDMGAYESQRMVEVSLAGVMAMEGVAEFIFPVTLSEPANVPVSVAFATSNGTAEAGSDFVATNGVLVIPPGATNGTITVQVGGDGSYEPDEAFEVWLSAPVNAVLATNRAAGTIRNDDWTDWSVADAGVSEGQAGTTALIFIVTRAGAVDEPASVDYTTFDGSAGAAVDYLPMDGTLQFAAGQATATVAVAVRGDTLYEADETFFVEIAAAGPADRMLRDQATGMILNDDSPASASITDGSWLEGNTGVSNAWFTVTLTKTVGVAVSIGFLASNGTAVAGADFAATGGVLTIPEGQLSGAIAVAVLGERVNEGNETFSLRLDTPVHVTLADAVGAGTIRNDDGPPTIRVDDPRQDEGNTGTTALAFTVMLSDPSAFPITVQFQTGNGTASSGSDYVSTNGTLTILPMTPSGTVIVRVKGDATIETNETVHLYLGNPSGATIADSSGTGTILDDDRPRPVLAPATIQALAPEGASVVVHWSATNGPRYTLQTSGDLLNSNGWCDVGPTGRLGPISAPWSMFGADPSGGVRTAPAFYRVKAVSQ